MIFKEIGKLEIEPLSINFCNSSFTRCISSCNRNVFLIFATNHLSSIRPFSISDPSSAIHIFTIYKVYFLPIVDIYFFLSLLYFLLVTFIFSSYCRNIFPSRHFHISFSSLLYFLSIAEIYFLLVTFIFSFYCRNIFPSCHFHTVVARVFKMNCNTSLKKVSLQFCILSFCILSSLK